MAVYALVVRRDSRTTAARLDSDAEEKGGATELGEVSRQWTSSLEGARDDSKRAFGTKTVALA